MRILISSSALFIAFILILGYSSGDDGTNYYEKGFHANMDSISIIESFSSSALFSCHIENKSCIARTTQNKIIFYDDELNVMKEMDSLQGNVALFYDVNDDGTDEIFISMKEENTLRISVFDYSGRLLKLFTKNGENDSSFRAELLEDINNDGMEELVCRVTSGYSLGMRGLVVYDYESGEELWSAETGPPLTDIITYDIDNDGRKEIISGSYAPHNGRVGEYGDDDGHSYIYCWDDNGLLLWKYETGGYFTGCDVSAYDRKIISAVHTAEDFRDDFGKLLVIDSDGKMLGEQHFDHGLYGLCVGDVSADDGYEIVVGSNNYELLIYSLDLEPIDVIVYNKSNTDYWYFIFPQFLIDLNDDRFAEIVCSMYERHETYHSVSGSINQLTDVKLLIFSPEGEVKQKFLSISEVEDRTSGASVRILSADSRLMIAFTANRSHILSFDAIETKDFEIYGDKNAVCERGDMLSLKVYVKNTGNVVSDYTAKIDAAHGWHARLSRTKFTLSPGEDVSLQISSHVPENAHGNYEFRLSVSDGISTKTHTINIKVVVREHEFEILCCKDLLILAGETKRIPVTVKNIGDFDDNYTCKVISELQTTPLEDFSLLSEEMKTFYLEITAPEYSSEGNYTLKLLINNGYVIHTHVTNITVTLPRHKIEMHTDSDVYATKWRDALTIHVTLINKGDFDEKVVVSSQWSESRSTQLPKGEEKSILLNIKPPYNATPGRYVLNLSGKSDAVTVYKEVDVRISDEPSSHDPPYFLISVPISIIITSAYIWMVRRCML